MNSTEFSTTTSPRPSFSTFFRQFLSPSRKPPSPPLSPASSTVTGTGSSSEDIHQLFNYFDNNNDGKITPTDLQTRLQLSDEEAELAVQSSDSDGDGALGLEDFEKLMKEGEDEEGELRGAFAMYSVKDGSVITPASLKKMMRRLGQAATVGECKVMIGRFDRNGDGVLDFHEFRVMMS